MNKLAQHIYALIKAHKGISLDELTLLANVEDVNALDEEIKNLIGRGYVTFIWAKLYPNVRTIGLVPKGERQTAAEIELTGISAEDLKMVLQPYDDDPLFYDAYPIEEYNKDFFEKQYHLDFDFDHFDYYLLCGFDNSEEQQPNNLSHQL